MSDVQVHNFTFSSQEPLQQLSHLRARGVEGTKIDLAFVDPPYNLGVKYHDDPTKDKLHLDTYTMLCSRVATLASMLVHHSGLLFWLCPSSHIDFIPAILTSCFGPRLYTIIKQETFSQYQQTRLTNEYRFLFVHQNMYGATSNNDSTFNPNAIRIPSDRQLKYKDKRANPKGRVPGDVWKIRRLQGTSIDHVDWHPAQLPPELLERIVLGWTNEGDTVLDMFAGSGNMGLVCQRHNRNAILLDGSETYCGKMRERLGITVDKIAHTPEKN